MLIKYGTYSIPAGRSEISHTRQLTYNSAEQPLSEVVRVQVDSRLKANDSPTMDLLVKQLLTGFNNNGKDFIVYLPNGTTASQLSLRTNDALGGVRIIQRPSFSTLQNAAYVTWLPFTFILEAEIPVTNAANLLTEFEETLTFEGGGPVNAWWKPLVGAPQRQQVRQFDTYRATQTGSAVGYLSRPSPPPPLWLNAMNKFPSASKKSPKRFGDDYKNFGISWTYDFESDSPLVGNPNAWLL